MPQIKLSVLIALDAVPVELILAATIAAPGRSVIQTHFPVQAGSVASITLHVDAVGSVTVVRTCSNTRAAS